LVIDFIQIVEKFAEEKIYSASYQKSLRISWVFATKQFVGYVK